MCFEPTIVQPAVVETAGVEPMDIEPVIVEVESSSGETEYVERRCVRVQVCVEVPHLSPAQQAAWDRKGAQEAVSTSDSARA